MNGKIKVTTIPTDQGARVAVVIDVEGQPNMAALLEPAQALALCSDLAGELADMGIVQALGQPWKPGTN
jgi:hypothetical protein